MKVLITGGSGLIGQALTTHLQHLGYEVAWLGRKTGKGKVQTFVWDPDAGTVDENAFNGIEVLVHLAGANIGEKRWTEERKKEILESRIKSTAILEKSLKNRGGKIPLIISASAIGYYGDTGQNWVNEYSANGNNFQAQVTVAWEKATESLEPLCQRFIRLRTGVVLSTRGGAMPKMMMTAKWGLGAIGSGKQWVPWIHIEDLCEAFTFLMDNDNLKGNFNLVAPNPLQYNALNRELVAAFHKKVWTPNAPAFLLRLVLGEMAQLVLGSIRAEPARLLKAGFAFRFPRAKEAVINLISRGI